MPITEWDLLSAYGAAVESRNAALFVGAGFSMSAGYPNWSELIAKPRRDAKVPANLYDMPLVAQYYVNAVPGGRAKLEDHILRSLKSATLRPFEGHGLVARLPVDDIWTTNYDCLLEQAIPDARVITGEKDFEHHRSSTGARVTKMHGSLAEMADAWREPPTITRSDYEEYELKHPRTWAALKATYLTKSFLFLGFSFTDPNIDILLRLSRSLQNVGAPKHFTILRRPTKTTELRLYNLRVQDLEKTGIAVCEIGDYGRILPILGGLQHRTRRPLLMISGSDSGASQIDDLGDLIGNRLADKEIVLASLAGPAGLRVSFAYGKALEASDKYDPARVNFYFRRSSTPAPPLENRIGTAIYTGATREEIRDSILSQCRALLVVGGGSVTEDEVSAARNLRIPVIPVAAAGGFAKDLYTNCLIEDLLTSQVTDEDRRDWNHLSNNDNLIVASAAIRLIRRAMYLDAS